MFYLITIQELMKLLNQKWPCEGPRWFKLKKMSKCQKDVKCQKVKHIDYGGGSQKN